ncbi:hypothetical protein NHQ30_001210 [Ciborinia camelliae]|nr:hypothetical protein NHQ30_001210 [Ciborinia camelliae]
MESPVIPTHDSIFFDAETTPAPIFNNGASSLEDTSPGSEAVASESKDSSAYRYLAIRPRNDSNPRASHNRSGQNPEKAIPITQRRVKTSIKHPYTGLDFPYSYTEFEPTGAITIKGFVHQPAPENVELPASKPDEPEEPWKLFPPPANAAYTGLGRKSEEEYDPQPFDTFDVALDGAGLAIKNKTSPQNTVSAGTANTGQGSSTGDMVATGISFTKKSWVEYEPSASGEIYNGDEQKADFIRNLDQGAQIEYCKKCKETHIPPGSPLTLPERDTCGAYLPEWFSTEGVDKPWANFMQMVNHWVLLSEIEQGYTHKENPERPIWNLEYHDTHSKWKQIGRSRGRGGWWKCRKGPDATRAERSCRVCTSKYAVENDDEERAKRLNTTVEECKAKIEDWVTEMVKKGGLRDKEAVLAMWRTNGIPQHYGPRALKNGMYPVTEGTRRVTEILAAPRTFFSPEQMFSERLFKGNRNRHPTRKSTEKALETIAPDSDLSSSASNTPPSVGQPDALSETLVRVHLTMRS